MLRSLRLRPRKANYTTKRNKFSYKHNNTRHFKKNINSHEMVYLRHYIDTKNHILLQTHLDKYRDAEVKYYSVPESIQKYVLKPELDFLGLIGKAVLCDDVTTLKLLENYFNVIEDKYFRDTELESIYIKAINLGFTKTVRFLYVDRKIYPPTLISYYASKKMYYLLQQKNLKHYPYQTDINIIFRNICTLKNGFDFDTCKLIMNDFREHITDPISLLKSIYTHDNSINIIYIFDLFKDKCDKYSFDVPLTCNSEVYKYLYENKLTGDKNVIYLG
jgi:hypothetical protein